MTKDDILEEIFRHDIKGNKFEAFLECEKIALENGCFPETLEKKDLPPEVLKQVKREKVGEVYQKELLWKRMIK